MAAAGPKSGTRAELHVTGLGDNGRETARSVSPERCEIIIAYLLEYRPPPIEVVDLPITTRTLAGQTGIQGIVSAGGYLRSTPHEQLVQRVPPGCARMWAAKQDGSALNFQLAEFDPAMLTDVPPQAMAYGLQVDAKGGFTKYTVFRVWVLGSGLIGETVIIASATVPDGRSLAARAAVQQWWAAVEGVTR